MTNDVSEALKKVSKGHIEFKMDKTSNVHVGLGKVSLPYTSTLSFISLAICFLGTSLRTSSISCVLLLNNFIILQVSYAEDNLRENVGAFVNALLLAKPAGLKKGK